MGILEKIIGEEMAKEMKGKESGRKQLIEREDRKKIKKQKEKQYWEEDSYSRFSEIDKTTSEESSTKKTLKVIGIITVVLLVFASWFFGFFGIIFYILGFYVVLYFLSLLFKTTAIIDSIMAIGGIILYFGFMVLGVFLLYLVLRYMFEENFFIGLLLLIFGLPVAEMLFYAIMMALGAHLSYFRELLEEKLKNKTTFNDSRYY